MRNSWLYRRSERRADTTCGTEALEYRGYDSAGIAVLDRGVIGDGKGIRQINISLPEDKRRRRSNRKFRHRTYPLGYSGAPTDTNATPICQTTVNLLSYITE